MKIVGNRRIMWIKSFTRGFWVFVGTYFWSAGFGVHCEDAPGGIDVSKAPT